MRVIAGSARGVPLKGPPGPATRPTSDKVRGAIFDTLAADLAGARVLDLYAGTGALGIEALSRGAEACLFVEKASAACRVIAANLRATKLEQSAHVWCIGVEAALERLETHTSTSLTPLMPDPKRVGSHSVGGLQGRAPKGPGQAQLGSTLAAPTEQRHGPPVKDSAIVRPDPSGSVPSHDPLGSGRPRRGRGVGGEAIPSTFAPPYDVIVLDPPYGDTGILAVLDRIGRSRLPAWGGFVVLEHSKRVQVPPDPGALRLRRTRRYGDTVVTLWQCEEDAED